MKKSKHIPKPLLLEEGYFLETFYTTYEMMDESGQNWEHNCTYQLKPNALSGRHRILHLSSMQLAFDRNPGGLMNDAYSSSDAISVAVVDECEGKACFHRTKLEIGDILFFDNNHPYNFVTNDYHSYVVLSIQTDRLDILQPKLLQSLHHTIKDINGDFSRLLHQIWHRFTDTSGLKKDKKKYLEAEAEIISALGVLLETQTPVLTKLTKGEEIALSIRDQVYAHMDGAINISSLAKQYNVTERTLQYSFQSLFGFTPTYFIRQMKLNLVYRDLKFASIENETVSNIAHKWGFEHMGNLSKYYKILFNETPSQTLKTTYLAEDTIAEECVDRQEQMI